MLKKTVKRYLPLLFVVLALAFLICIYAPMETYVNNIDDFQYDLYYLLSVMIPVFIAVVLIVTAIGIAAGRISKKAYVIIILVLLSVLISAYLQGNFFSSNLPPLDGTEIDWHEYSSQRLMSLLIWLLPIAASAVLVKTSNERKLFKAAEAVGAFVFAVLLLSACFLPLKEGSLDRKHNLSVTDDYLMDFSDDRNFIIIMLDAVDAGTFNEVLTVHPEYKEYFRGFTFFKNTVGCYPYTSRAVPFVLTGVWNENKTSYVDYCNDAFARSPIFSAVRSEGYRMGDYCPIECEFVDALPDMFENVYGNNSRCFSWRFVKSQLQLAGYKYFPFDLKRFCIANEKDLNSGLSAVADAGTTYEVGLSDYRNYVESMDIAVQHDKTFKFIYNIGAHTGFECKAMSDAFDDYTYEAKMENAMYITGLLMGKMKKENVYDNSVIIILADHGYNGNSMGEGRQNPMLMIKGIGETHEFAVSDVPLSYEDLQSAYLNLLSGQPAEQAYPVSTGPEGRRFLFCEYNGEEFLEEYRQTGYADDWSTMVPTGNKYTRIDAAYVFDGFRNKLNQEH